jgi:hypothetical protein
MNICKYPISGDHKDLPLAFLLVESIKDLMILI